MMIIFYQIIFQKYSGEIISPFRPVFSPQNIAKISHKYCTTIPTFFQRKNINNEKVPEKHRTKVPFGDLLLLLLRKEQDGIHMPRRLMDDLKGEVADEKFHECALGHDILSADLDCES